jgi:hypothetical protein
MASEIRVDKINSLSGVGTVTLSPTGVDIAGITTAATLRATTGIVTSLTAGSLTSLGAVSGTTGTFSGAVSGTTGAFTSNVSIGGNFSIPDKIIHIDDTNTSIRFPAADTFTVETGGSERLRIDSSGRIGVGVVPTTQFNHSLIQIGNQATLGANGALSSTGQTFLTHNLYYDTGGTYQVFNTSNANEGAIIQIREAYFAFSNSPQTTGTPTVTERFRIAADGDVEVKTGNLVIGTAGKGIDFSEDGNTGNMTSELLDDYEEGTHVSTVTLGTGSFTNDYGTTLNYTKIGRFVHVTGRIYKTHSVTDTSTYQFSLPFACSSGGNAVESGGMLKVFRANAVSGEHAAGMRAYRIESGNAFAKLATNTTMNGGNFGTTNPHIIVNVKYIADT